MTRKLAISLTLLAPLFAACDAGEKCEPLADHILEVVAKTQPEATDEAKAKARKDLVAACAQDLPEPAVYDCAMAADTVEALNKCDEKATKE